MTIQLNKKSVFNEFEWVIRVLDSAESEKQMDVVLNCFSVWQKKHTFKKLKADEILFLNALCSKYWARFKNKSVSFGYTTNFYK
jgi:hypothetical protein